MSKVIDLTGQKFGKLTVLNNYMQNDKRKTYWLCECECGNKKYIYRHSLISGRTTSCGCNIIKHNKYETRLYHIWGNMKYRCNTPTCDAYMNYGGKGIKVYNEWNDDFVNFYNWAVSNGYNENLTIDRIDSNKNYCPENCRWVTKSQNTSYSNKSSQHRKANKGKYYGINPEGDYIEFENANKFAKDYNLNSKLIRDMANKRKYKNSLYRGWRFGFVVDLKEGDKE